MGIQRGYNEIDKRNKEEEEKRKEQMNYVPFLNLPISGKARIRILSEPITYNSHKIYDLVKKRTYYRYCSIEDEKDEMCKYCNSGLKSSRTFMFWVYVYFKLALTEGRYGIWSPVSYQNKKMFQQIVEKSMVLRRGMGKGNSMFDKFASNYLEYGSWQDRDYTWSRNDAKVWNETDYFLNPRDPSEVSPKLKKIAELVPSLNDIALGEQVVMPKFDVGGNPVKQEKETKTKVEMKQESAPALMPVPTSIVVPAKVDKEEDIFNSPIDVDSPIDDEESSDE